MDWIVLTIIGLIVFLAWHVYATPHPSKMTPSPVTVIVPPVQRHAIQQKGGEVPLEKAPTIFAEPGLAGRLIDPLQTEGVVLPADDLAGSSIASSF